MQITLTGPERNFLQSVVNDRWQDDYVRFYEGSLFRSILDKLIASNTPDFTEQEIDRLDYMLQKLTEKVAPLADPYYVLTTRMSGPPTTTHAALISSIRKKLEVKVN